MTGISKEKTKKRFVTWILFFPMVVLIAALFLYGPSLRQITPAHILAYTPKNLFLAALVIIGLYALKSVMIFFPVVVITVSAGLIFPLFWAIVVNFIGLCVGTTICYYLGRFTGKEYVDAILKKYKKIEGLKTIRRSNEWFYAYLLRIVSVLPIDIVGLFLGSLGMHYWPYMVGSLLGMLPGMVIHTFIGTAINKRSLAILIGACLLSLLLTIGSYLFYRSLTAKSARDR